MAYPCLVGPYSSRWRMFQSFIFFYGIVAGVRLLFLILTPLRGAPPKDSLAAGSGPPPPNGLVMRWTPHQQQVPSKRF